MPEIPYQPQKDFASLLDLAVLMVQTQAGLAIPIGKAWLNDRQTLAKKLIFHLHSIKTIQASSILRVGEVETPIVDHGSITVLVRAVIENFIVFAFIYGNEDPEVCRFRHMTWRLGGLMDRQRHEPITDVHRLKLANEKQQLAQLRQEVQQHPIFAGLHSKERKAIVSGDWGMGKRWAELAVGVGIDGHYFRKIYRYACSYSHSSYAAVLQVGQLKTLEAQAEMSTGLFGTMNIVMAHFIATYANLFEAALALLKQSESREIAERWFFTADRFASMYKANT